MSGIQLSDSTEILEALEGPLNPGNLLCKDFRFPAVYILLLGSEIVYIGQSRNVSARISAHLQEGLKEFNSVLLLRCHVTELIATEASLIKRFVPKHNNCHIAYNSRMLESWKGMKPYRPSNNKAQRTDQTCSVVVRFGRRRSRIRVKVSP